MTARERPISPEIREKIEAAETAGFSDDADVQEYWADQVRKPGVKGLTKAEVQKAAEISDRVRDMARIWRVDSDERGSVLARVFESSEARRTDSYER